MVGNRTALVLLLLCIACRAKPAPQPSPAEELSSAPKPLTVEDECASKVPAIPGSRLVVKFLAEEFGSGDDEHQTRSYLLASVDEQRAVALIYGGEAPAIVGDDLRIVDWKTNATTHLSLHALWGGPSRFDKEHEDFATPEASGEVIAYAKATIAATSPAQRAHARIAPGGHALLLQQRDALYRVDVDTPQVSSIRTAQGVSSFAVSPKPDMVAYVGLAGRTTRTLRLLDTSSPAHAERIVTGVKDPADSFFFSSDGATLFASARSALEAPCAYAVDVASGESRKLACAKTASRPYLLLSPDGSQLALIAFAGPSGSDPEATLIPLPDGRMKARQTLSWFEPNALTNDARLIGIPYTSQWGGNRGDLLVESAIDSTKAATLAANTNQWPAVVVDSRLTDEGSRVAILMKRGRIIELDLADVPPALPGPLTPRVDPKPTPR